MSRFFVLFCGFALLTLNACTVTGMAVGAAATTGVAAAQEGGLTRAVSDAWIKTQVNEKWLSHDVDTFAKLGTTVKQGRVLVTGVVQNPDERVEAIRLVWQVEGVKQVINEIRVAESEGVSGFVQDAWISSRLRTAMMFNKNVQSINYSIDTVQGVVYLMGWAQSQAELDTVVGLARTISGVKQVVSYVKLVGQHEDAPALNQTFAVEGGEQYQSQSQSQSFDATSQPIPVRPAPTYNANDDMTGTGTGYTDQGGTLMPAPVESAPLTTSTY